MALKIGAEDKKKVAIAGVLGVILLLLVGRMVLQSFGGNSAPAAVSQTVPVAAPVSAPVEAQPPANAVAEGAGPAAVKVAGSLANLDPTLHPEVMAGAESLEYSGTGRNIFSMTSAPPQIEKVNAPIRQQAGVSAPQGPPPPPPIDLKFFGYETQNGNRKAFLLHGDDVFIATAGDVVDHRYKVVQIQPFSMLVEDLPFHNTQSLPLIQN